MNDSDSTEYDPISRIFHWLTAVAVLVAFILGPGGFGRLMRRGVDPATRLDIVMHESLGVLVFCLTVLRLLWLFFRPEAPQLPMAAWMRSAAKLGHALLWALMLALPATALLALGSESHPLTLLGGYRIDDMPWIAQLPFAGLADWGHVHGFLGDAIMWLAGLHAAAALFHHVVLKDGVLRSMLPLPQRR